MGYWKDIIERLGGGNPAAYETDYVCAECFENQALKDFIESEVQAQSCTSAARGPMNQSQRRSLTS